MTTIFSRIRLSKRQLVYLTVFLAVATVAEMLLPTMLSSIIENGIRQENTSHIFMIAGIMVGLVLLGFFASLVGNYLSSSIAAKFAQDLRQEIFEQITSFSTTEFDQFGTASLVTRSTSDISNIQEFMTMALQFGLFAPLMFITGIILSISTGGQLSLIVVIAIPVLIIVATVLIVLASRYSLKIRNTLDRINRRFLEVLEGVRVIRAFNKEEFEMEKFSSVNQDYTDSDVKHGRFMNGLMPSVQLIFGLTTTGILTYGAYLLTERQIEVGVIVANTEYISMILFAVIIAIVLISMFPATLACLRRVAAVLNTNSSIRDGERVSVISQEAEITFKDVTFGYDEASEPLLKNLNFTAKPGQVTAIIGRTASGKSSVLKLIPRLHDVLFGQILLNGQDIKDYSLATLRSMIGYVPQKNQLFSGTIASNLNFGREDGQELDWEKASMIANASEFVKDKEGHYQAQVAQGGANFSGGQRQRLAIARAVMKNPAVFLFDDSLSALDMKTDRQIRENIKKHLSHATILIVAQRISSIMDANQILVIDKGEIVGKGTHRELLQTNSLYREIAELQLGKEAIQNEN